MPSVRLALAMGTAIAATGPVAAQNASDNLQDPKAADVQIVGHVLEPKALKPTPEHLGQLSLPDGFEISIFAEGLTNPRMMAVADDGTVYVSQRVTGDLMMLRDEDGDGRADTQESVAQRPMMHGVEIDGDTIYLVTVNDIYRSQIQGDGTLGELERIVDDLPEAGQHPNRTVQMGPDGKLYVSVGSTCNACGETSPENATMLRVEPDGSSRTIFASGLRNTIGFEFHPETGELYGMDHGIDWLGDEEQAEELNHIEEGKKYGWPYIYADGKFNPQDEPPGGISLEEWAEQSTEPVMLYTPHAAPMQLAFYEGDQFPQEYRGDAFVAMRGSWNRKPPSGYEVLRIRFENGQPAEFEPFVTGFLMETDEGWGHLGRLAGMAVAGDGALLLSDDKNGVIYRIAYAGEASEAAPAEATGEQASSEVPTPPDAAEAPDAPADLVKDVIAETGEPLDLTSSAFESGQPIPDVHAAEGENVSPPLDWAEGPDGTRSYVVVMQDPDAGTKPFVHWLAYNIPADVTSLREGIPGMPKLAKPEGVLQGLNDRGSIGYFGPRPPKGDQPHDYHLQVFALDTSLDLPHGATLDEVVAAMLGHVLGMGEITGTYQR